MEEKENKSKYDAQIKYIKNNYKRFRIDIKNEEFEKLQDICKKKNTTLTTEIKKFLESFLDNNLQ